MRAHKAAAATIFTCIGLVACTQNTHSVSWWKKQDDAKIKSFVKKCHDNTANEVGANCQNAMKAKFQKDLETKEIKSPSISN